MDASTFSGTSQPSTDDQILKDKLDILSGNYNAIAYANIVVSSLTTFVLFDDVSSALLLPWCAFIIILTVIRILLRNQYYRHAKSAFIDVHYWSATYTTISAISGLAWGIGAWFFITESQPHLTAFIAVAWIGMAAGTIGSQGVHLPGFLAFALPLMLSLSTRITMIDGTSYTVLGFFAFSLTGGLVSFARANQQSVQESLKLRYQNRFLLNQLEKNNQELQAQVKQVELANQKKSKFLAAASHDLRQPLQSITLFSEALKHNAHQSDDQHTLAKMCQSIEALNALFNRLLDVSRLDAGDVTRIIQPVSLNTLFEKLIQNFSVNCQQQNIELKTVATNAWVMTDPDLLFRCLSNLVHNAIQHSHGSKILIGVRRFGKKKVIVVADNGCGISSAEQAHIFEEFYQLHNPERDRNKGLGLGLAIVERTLKLLEHPLTLISKEKIGTRFNIELPAATAQIAPQPIQATTAKLHFNRQKVLVIDDEQDIRDAMTILLTQWNLEVRTVADKPSLLKLIDTEYTPDVVISDYRLPDKVTGSELIQALNQARQIKIPAMLITGDTDPSRIAEARSTGLVLLHKPIQPAKLRIAMAHLLHSE